MGFYGGINYGFGYTGVGFLGGRWNGGVFAYNTAVLNVDRGRVHNVYVEDIHVRNVNVHTSFNGGTRGIFARPSPDEIRWSRERHMEWTVEQQRHVALAHGERSNFISVNGGHPEYGAMERVGERPVNHGQAIQQERHERNEERKEDRDIHRDKHDNGRRNR